MSSTSSAQKMDAKPETASRDDSAKPSGPEITPAGQSSKPKRRGRASPKTSFNEPRGKSEVLAEVRGARGKMGCGRSTSTRGQRQNSIDSQSSSLKTFLQPRYASNMSGTDLYLEHYPMFFIQIAPWSPNGAKCQFVGCEAGNIRPGEYRIALKPGTFAAAYHKSPGRCFCPVRVPMSLLRTFSRQLPHSLPRGTTRSVLSGDPLSSAD